MNSLDHAVISNTMVNGDIFPKYKVIGNIKIVITPKMLSTMDSNNKKREPFT